MAPGEFQKPSHDDFERVSSRFWTPEFTANVHQYLSERYKPAHLASSNHQHWRLPYQEPCMICGKTGKGCIIDPEGQRVAVCTQEPYWSRRDSDEEGVTSVPGIPYKHGRFRGFAHIVGDYDARNLLPVRRAGMGEEQQRLLEEMTAAATNEEYVRKVMDRLRREGMPFEDIELTSPLLLKAMCLCKNTTDVMNFHAHVKALINNQREKKLMESEGEEVEGHD